MNSLFLPNTVWLSHAQWLQSSCVITFYKATRNSKKLKVLFKWYKLNFNCRSIDIKLWRAKWRAIIACLLAATKNNSDWAVERLIQSFTNHRIVINRKMRLSFQSNYLIGWCNKQKNLLINSTKQVKRQLKMNQLSESF